MTVSVFGVQKNERGTLRVALAWPGFGCRGVQPGRGVCDTQDGGGQVPSGSLSGLEQLLRKVRTQPCVWNRAKPQRLPGGNELPAWLRKERPAGGSGWGVG